MQTNFTKQFIDKVTMEKDINFDCIVIKPGSIKSVSWLEPDYTDRLMELDLITNITTNQSDFIKMIATSLEVDKYHINNVAIKNEIVDEEPYYLYELMYIDLDNHKEYKTELNLNEMASLINTNGEQIYSNAILLRTHVPSLSDSMLPCTVTKADISRFLRNRVHTKIGIWDGTWISDTVMGDLNMYAKTFFDCEESEIKKVEFPFLMHNINIWYTIDPSNNDNICGKLIKEPIEKCIFFSMKSDEYRGSITLDEINKIIYLSNKLETYQTPSELLEDKNDSFGRKIVYNKYKVLDYVYDKNK